MVTARDSGEAKWWMCTTQVSAWYMKLDFSKKTNILQNDTLWRGPQTELYLKSFKELHGQPPP